MAALALFVAGAVGAARSAQALVLPPVTLDGPSAQVLDFGGVAMADDGSGGLVYLKAVEGVPHVFACRYLEGRWTPPARVDWDQPYAASQPRIAAGPRGQLLVVWVTQVATVHGSVHYGLFSARIGVGGSSFGPSLPVDPDVGEGQGVDPSLAGASPGKAIVAYRAITYTFKPGTFSTAVQLRPGDVMADVRVARLSGERWSSLGPLNRNPEASTRPPSAVNGPQVGIGNDGAAVLAWQEPDQTGTARIWMRRIFGTTPGPVLQASPSSWENRPVSADADALSLSVTPYAGAQAAYRIAPGDATPLAGRLLISSLPASFATGAAMLANPQLADAGIEPAGPPDVAASETASKQPLLRLGFISGSQPQPQQLQLGPSGGLTALKGTTGLAAVDGGVPVVAVDPEGGGLVAYPALDLLGRPVVAVNQEFGGGAAQVGTISGGQGGPVAELSIGRSDAGDGLIAFRQGEAGRYAIVADRVSAPPAPFTVKAPKRWLRPPAVIVRWAAAASSVGGVTYAVLLDGQPVSSGLRRLRFDPRPGLLGNGKVWVQVRASDGFGQQLLSNRAMLRVDGEPPGVKVGVGKQGRVVVRLADSGSGLRAKATQVNFGDGARERGGGKLVHDYAHPGRYLVVVRARDRVGNRLWRRFEVNAR